MTRSQLDQVSELLRNSPLDLGGNIAEMRVVFDEMLGSAPLPEDVRTRNAELGGVSAIEVRAGTEDDAASGFGSGSGATLYFHGGAYAIGSAAASVGLASEIAWRTGTPVWTVDYRLAPEHPFPAAVHDALAAYQALLDQGAGADSIAVVGESVGPRALRIRSCDYLAGADPRTPTASPLHADLHGLPPLLIQVGSREILLDDALRLAARAARDDVAVALRTFPGAPHVFQGFAPVVEEAARALDELAAFITDHITDHATDHITHHVQQEVRA